MKFIYVLEDELKFQDEIYEALKKIDPQFEIRFFDSLQLFYDWIKQAIQKGPLSLSQGGRQHSSETLDKEKSESADHQLILVITKNEWLGSGNMALVRKTRDLFIRKNICSSEDPTNLVISSFDNPDFDIKLVEDRIINNVIYKPFDKLILQQHLAIAAYGHHPPKTQAIAVSKTKTIIEMLEDIEVEFISDVGMVTRSDRPIEEGAVSKYYSDLFRNNINRSAMAICLTCYPHPDNNSFYQAAFSFFGLNPLEISYLRRLLKDKNAKVVDYSWYDTKSLTSHSKGKSISIVILDQNEEDQQKISQYCLDIWLNIEITWIADLQQLIQHLKSTHQKPDIILAEDIYFQENPKEKWTGILGKDFQTAIFNICRKKLSDSEERSRASVCKDIFYWPLDSIYVFKKLKLFLPDLQAKEPWALQTVLKPVKMQAASPITVTEFSEAGIIMHYYRAISIGSFREFVLWLPKETGLPIVRATCNYAVALDTKPVTYNNHFVFFGMNDHFLKHMRIWIRENYILSKNKNE